MFCRIVSNNSQYLLRQKMYWWIPVIPLTDSLRSGHNMQLASLRLKQLREIKTDVANVEVTKTAEKIDKTKLWYGWNRIANLTNFFGINCRFDEYSMRLIITRYDDTMN